MDTEIKTETNNKIYIKDYKKHYRNFLDKNKEKIHEKITCEKCGGTYTYFNKSRHLKTSRHKKHIDQIEE